MRSRIKCRAEGEIPYHQLWKVTEGIPCLKHIVREVINKSQLQERKNVEREKAQSENCKKKETVRGNVQRNRKSQAG